MASLTRRILGLGSSVLATPKLFAATLLVIAILAAIPSAAQAAAPLLSQYLGRAEPSELFAGADRQEGGGDVRVGGMGVVRQASSWAAAAQCSSALRADITNLSTSSRVSGDAVQVSHLAHVRSKLCWRLSSLQRQQARPDTRSGPLAVRGRHRGQCSTNFHWSLYLLHEDGPSGEREGSCVRRGG